MTELQPFITTDGGAGWILITHRGPILVAQLQLVVPVNGARGNPKRPIRVG